MSKSIAKNAVFSAILNICNIALPIIVMPVVYGAIKSTLNGYLTMGETFTTFFMAFASFGVYQYGLREVSKVRHDDKKVRQTVTSLFLITTSATIIVTIAYALYIILYHNNDPYFYTCMVMGLNLVFNLFNVEWINEALENYNFIALKTMIVKIVYNILTLCFVRTEGDKRKDAAFTIFYMGINLGSFFAPLVCGTLEENLMATKQAGEIIHYGFRYGFLAAGIGMVIGQVIF
ncbi:lipopolysaccharide biosynthesis protein, partial [Clostridium saccharobutylicum]|uniref:lipopolysaccharide biosynthesis protein n=1 Tax=Clostridium saccharobutylicum TaxID=169679 RepID=UPI000AE6AD9D